MCMVFVHVCSSPLSNLEKRLYFQDARFEGYTTASHAKAVRTNSFSNKSKVLR